MLAQKVVVISDPTRADLMTARLDWKNEVKLMKVLRSRAAA